MPIFPSTQSEFESYALSIFPTTGLPDQEALADYWDLILEWCGGTGEQLAWQILIGEQLEAPIADVSTLLTQIGNIAFAEFPLLAIWAEPEVGGG